MDSRILQERMRHGVHHKDPLSVEVRRVIRSLTITLCLLFIAAISLFLYHTSRNAEQGFALRQIRVENEKQRTENQDLKQKVLDAQAFKNISESAVLEKMDPAGNPLYVPPDKLGYRGKALGERR